MPRRIEIMASSAALALALTGCGATSAPQQQSKTPEGSRASSKASSGEAWATSAEKGTSAPEQQGATADADSEARGDTTEQEQANLHALERPKSVLSVLTSPGVTFMTDYLRSEAYRSAASACDSIADAEEKRAQCLSQAREQFAADGMRFRQEEDGSLSWIVYKRKGDELSEAHSGKVEVVSYGPTSVTLALRGQEHGKRTLFKGQSRVVLNVPDEYSIELEDSSFGRLVYDAKFGFDSR